MLQEDLDDEWFFSSIKRYRDLIMFDTGHPVYAVEPIDHRHICTLTKSQKVNGEPNQRIISFLSLPLKITTNKELSNPIIKKNTDLKILSGIFPKKNPSQILAIYGENKIISSEQESDGIVVYRINDSDQMILDGSLNFPISNPQMCLIKQNLIVLARNNQCLIGDLNNGKVTLGINLKENHDPIVPSSLQENIILLLNKKSGISELFDTRSGSIIQKIDVSDNINSNWSQFSDYTPYQNVPALSTNVYFISNCGHFKQYDFRNPSIPTFTKKLPFSTKNDQFLKITTNPNNRDILSISGFDDSIYVYNLKNDLTELFKHDGHSKTENCDKNTIASDHFWYNDEFVISSALNNSINCWNPNVNFNNIIV